MRIAPAALFALRDPFEKLQVGLSACGRGQT